MKRISIPFALIVLAAMIVPFAVLSQDDLEDVTIRTLPIDYYASSSAGVKIMYRGFDNEQHYLYLPKSFEGTKYRFVMAPMGVATSGLPALIVRMRGKEVIFIDIYTKYLRSSASIADFDDEDLARFRTAEEKGKIEIVF